MWKYRKKYFLVEFLFSKNIEILISINAKIFYILKIFWKYFDRFVIKENFKKKKKIIIFYFQAKLNTKNNYSKQIIGYFKNKDHILK